MRIQVDFSDQQVAELRTLMEEIDIQNYKELFNNALTLFEWVIEEIKVGRVLAAVDEEEETYRVLVMPILQAAMKKFRREAANRRVPDTQLTRSASPERWYASGPRDTVERTDATF